MEKINLNPYRWEDPDTVGSSEYFAIHELATGVWDSNQGERRQERAGYVLSSLIELRNEVEGIILRYAAAYRERFLDTEI